MTSLRYTDLDPKSSGAGDFIIRRRLPTIPHLLIIFSSTLLIAVSVPLAVDNEHTQILLLFLVTTCVGWYTFVQIQRARDLLLATEFQNALFASALGLNHKFCMIIRRDGNIVYLDRSFQTMFPKFTRQSNRSLDALLAQAKVSRQESELVFAAIERGDYDKVVFNVRDDDNVPHKIVMGVEPIMRPKGFILLRGREFVEKRVNDETQAAGGSPYLNKPTIPLFSHIIDTMNMGVYMTNPAGIIMYANPVLEQWLGFGDGEITQRSLSLQDIIHHENGQINFAEPGDYEGETILRKKNGTLMKCFVNQKVLRDEQDRVIGCTAVAHPFNAQDTEIKKKLW